jgi:hypothetical protein
MQSEQKNEKVLVMKRNARKEEASSGTDEMTKILALSIKVYRCGTGQQR